MRRALLQTSPAVQLKEFIGSCDGVTACDTKTLKNPFIRELIKIFVGFVVTGCHTVTPSALIVRIFDSDAKPNADLLGVAPSFHSYSIAFSAEFLKPIIKGVL